jgi:hypothetical protein
MLKVKQLKTVLGTGIPKGAKLPLFLKMQTLQHAALYVF